VKVFREIVFWLGFLLAVVSLPWLIAGTVLPVQFFSVPDHGYLGAGAGALLMLAAWVMGRGSR